MLFREPPVQRRSRRARAAFEQEASMTTGRKLAAKTLVSATLPALAIAGALAFLTVPAQAQTTQPPAQDTQREAPGAMPGGMGQPPEAMREMMRDMMQEMMRQDAPRAMTQDRGRMRGWTDRRARDSSGPDRDRMMGHGGMMGRGDMMGRGAMHGAGLRIMFAIMDADGDGALTLEEVQDFHERIFNAIDQNDDGEITMEEIQAFFRGDIE
jgi:hypothetical protein